MIGAAVMVGGIAETLPFVRLNLLLLLHNALGRPLPVAARIQHPKPDFSRPVRPAAARPRPFRSCFALGRRLIVVRRAPDTEQRSVRAPGETCAPLYAIQTFTPRNNPYPGGESRASGGIRTPYPG